MLTKGLALSDRYRLSERVATGGMGTVWRCVDTLLDREVAVKILLPTLVDDPEFTTRFHAEARMLAALRHPGIVAVHDFGSTTLPDGNRISYLVMEYVNGEPLHAWIRRAGRLDPTTTMSAVAQAATALHVAHTAGIVHRDVKPGNLLVKPDGTIVLVDFGIARSAASLGLTASHMVLGSASYMSPEQVNHQPVSPATDVYALGAVAYHCLTGQPPFVGTTLLQVALQHAQEPPPPLSPDIPPPVAAVVERALAKSPGDRFPTAAAMAEAAGAAAPAVRPALPGPRSPGQALPPPPPWPPPGDGSASPSWSAPAADRAADPSAAPTDDRPADPAGGEPPSPPSKLTAGAAGAPPADPSGGIAAPVAPSGDRPPAPTGDGPAGSPTDSADGRAAAVDQRAAASPAAPTNDRPAAPADRVGVPGNSSRPTTPAGGRSRRRRLAVAGAAGVAAAVLAGVGLILALPPDTPGQGGPEPTAGGSAAGSALPGPAAAVTNNGRPGPSGGTLPGWSTPGAGGAVPTGSREPGPGAGPGSPPGSPPGNRPAPEPGVSASNPPPSDPPRTTSPPRTN
ncbi:serine/threonine-protein kinase, partial [Micromonospora sp. KC721]|uniref:serine/threonine-protein kinase n=1 Tax=Micromonospora sp. KC721 TaxID=2530380 RepID=UPI0010504257